MIHLLIDHDSEQPLYEQIVGEVKRLIASGRLRPGTQLPAVRQLASDLSLSPGTVLRAYMELGRQHIVSSRRGGGTFVSAGTDDPRVIAIHQKHLSDLVSSDILEVLSQGYSPEELEAVFSVHLDRWREERSFPVVQVEEAVQPSGSPDTIRIVGSHDVALNLLVSRVRREHPEIRIEITHAGSLGGLIAVQDERADIAGIHLLDEETGEYNNPYVKRVFPGRETAVVHLAYRIQGLMFLKGNPGNIICLEDLTRAGIVFVNRQRGSGTRVLLDLKLREQGILPSRIEGYERELDTHTAVATSVARGEADVGLGIEVAAHTSGLDFQPLFRERYDMVMPFSVFQSDRLKPFLDIIQSEKFKKIVDNAGGYDTSNIGSVTLLNVTG